MLKRIRNILFGFNNKHKIPNGSIFPIIRTVKYNKNLDSEPIKSNLLRKMLGELMQYTTFEVEETENGVNLLTARLDVLVRDNKDG